MGRRGWLIIIVVWIGVAVTPTIAAAHGGHRGHDSYRVFDAALDPEAAATVDERQRSALRRLPLERASGTCGSTASVPGFGQACQTARGTFRFVVPGLGEVESHGGDPATFGIGESGHGRTHELSSQLAVDTASKDDIACVTDVTQPRVELVYVYRTGDTDRSDVVVPAMRHAIYQASAFMDAESRLIDEVSGRRLRVGCDAHGVPNVHVVHAADSPSASILSFPMLAEALEPLYAAGGPFGGEARNSVRPVLFLDRPGPPGVAGLATWSGDIDDDRSDVTSVANDAGRLAMEFAWSSSRLPHWDVLLHEIAHTMGAVSDAAPHASGAGHCNDGFDLLCYGDGGPLSSYVTGACTHERFDCGANTYFHPNPSEGTWLAEHWNLAGAANRYVEPRVARWSGAGADTMAPTPPSGLRVERATTSKLDLRWEPGIDDKSSVSTILDVERLGADGAWSRMTRYGPMRPSKMSIAALAPETSYRIRIRALDGDANVSDEAILDTHTETWRPGPPTAISIDAPYESGLHADWTEMPGAIAATYNDVRLERLRGAAWELVEAKRIAESESSFAGITADSTYRVQVRSVANGDGKEWLGSYAVSDSLVAPRFPTRDPSDNGLPAPRVRASTTKTTVTATWNLAPGAVSWTAWLADGRGNTVASRRVSMPRTTFLAVRPGRVLTLHVVAHSSPDAWTYSPHVPIKVRTRDDRALPSRVRVRRIVITSRGIDITWSPARDDAGIAGYHLQCAVRRPESRPWTRTVWRAPRVRRWRTDWCRGGTADVRVRAVDVVGKRGAWTIVRGGR